MSSFLCKAETLSLIAEKLAERAEKLGRAHGGDIQFWFKKITKMNRISAECFDTDAEPREYIQQVHKRFIRPVDIAMACQCYDYQVAGFHYAGINKENLHVFDFENNHTMREIRAIGHQAAMVALRNADPHGCMRADEEWWA